MCNGQMSIPYERFVHCPDHKLLYNFNKYVCKINVTITIKLIVISVVVFDKINSFAASSSSASSSSSSPPPPPPPRGKAMRVAGAVKKVGAALAGVTLQAVAALLLAAAEGPALLQAVAGLLLAVPVGPALLQAAAALLLAVADLGHPRQRSLSLSLSCLQPSMWQTDY